MKTEAVEKAFDCVKWTRRTRDRISTQIRDMSREELERWFDTRRPTDPFLAELYDRRKPPRPLGRTRSPQSVGTESASDA